MADQAELPVPDLTGADVAFPAHALDWMPAMDDIPDEFKQFKGTVWNEIAHSWFYNGLPENVEFHARQGVDPEQAFRAANAALGSFAPKHQHKMAAVAYMLSCWFVRVDNWKQSKPAG
ncbi:MAG: hypothetical protein WBM00_09445 [Solirubrobacterales bacterium]